jgi:hypothetical protein
MRNILFESCQIKVELEGEERWGSARGLMSDETCFLFSLASTLAPSIYTSVAGGRG